MDVAQIWDGTMCTLVAMSAAKWYISNLTNEKNKAIKRINSFG